MNEINVKHAQHRRTIESLSSIIAGLDVGSKDSVLAVGAGGDVAFALLENANIVKVVDVNPNQLAYIKMRKEALEKGDWYGFFDPLKDNQHSYNLELEVHFTDKRLKKLRERLDRMQISEVSNNLLTEPSLFEGADKIYLSNILDWCDVRYDKALPVFENWKAHIKDKALLYVAKGAEVAGYLPDGFEIDKKRTSKAITKYHDNPGCSTTIWEPLLIRKNEEAIRKIKNQTVLDYIFDVYRIYGLNR